MNVPLTWLAEYVSLPKSETELTDKLTMVGHMLNKRWKTDDGEVVIDLELRGNRSDLFGILGVAREVSAIWDKPLKFPITTKLPVTSSKSNLVTVEAKDLVERFLAFKLKVKIGPSPEWLVKRLAHFGLPTINNVVDITNYVMVETGEPMHAYDTSKLKGQRLILRRGKRNEHFTTLLGTKLTLSTDDLVVSDEEKVVGLTMIGGLESGVDNNTKEVILEAAVYNQANVRRTARKLNIFTEAGTRHEKLLDPNQVEYALSRALELLIKHADAEITSESADFYPKKSTPKLIKLAETRVEELTGTHVEIKKQIQILSSLGCKVALKKNVIEALAPTFRTDILESADLVEEVIRIYGYELIPTQPLTGVLPPIQTPATINFSNKLKNILVGMGINEIITSPFVATNDQGVKVINAPDPGIASLRTSLIPSLVSYVKKSLGYRVNRVSLFEIGKIYLKDNSEEEFLGISLSGQTDNKSWNRKPRELNIYDLIGTLDLLAKNLGTDFQFDNDGTILNGSLKLGTITNEQKIYTAQINISKLNKISEKKKTNYLAPTFPPTIEDFSFTIEKGTNIRKLIIDIKSLNSLISKVSLVDCFENSRTIEVEYSSLDDTLTDKKILPIRQRIINLLTTKYSATLR